MKNLASSLDFEQRVASSRLGSQQQPDDFLEKLVKENIRGILKEKHHLKHLPTTEFVDFPSNDTAAQFNMTDSIEERIKLRDVVPPIGFSHMHPKWTRTMTSTAEWEGYVESISEDEFCVKMVDVRSKVSLPTDQAVFSKDDISEYDRQNLKVGAIIRWVIGRERLLSGQIRKVSEIHFRQLPIHTKADYDRALNKAKALLDEVVWDDAEGG